MEHREQQHRDRADFHVDRATQAERRARALQEARRGKRDDAFHAWRLAAIDDHAALAPSAAAVHTAAGGGRAMVVEVEEVPQPRRPLGGRRFAKRLMEAEPMEAVPADLVESWNAVVCPKGRRCLVIAANGQTSARYDDGSLFLVFSSGLVGGSRQTRGTGGAAHACLLDCIYDSQRDVFYVLDVLFWGTPPVHDCDREFRTFWLHAKLAEANTAVRSAVNRVPFVALTSLPCNADTLAGALRATWPYDVVGMLFYHKEAIYTAGRSPTVLWLESADVAARLHAFFAPASGPVP